MSEHQDTLDFAPEHDAPVPYMQRISTYYQTLGYGRAYQWAHYAQVPFTRLARPLADVRVALVTTAAPYNPDAGDQGPGAPYNAAAKFYRVYSQPIDGEPDVRISHVGIDRKHTTAEDAGTWFPLAQLKRLAASGRIGELAPRFHGAPTNRSQRVTIEQDCADLLAVLRADRADAVVLAAN
jgi:D-proline reductase (dithiol) PrdB